MASPRTQAQLEALRLAAVARLQRDIDEIKANGVNALGYAKLTNQPDLPVSASNTVRLRLAAGVLQASVDGAAYKELPLANAFSVIPSRFTGVVNVREFGAVGDGATDDLAAFNAALASFSEIGSSAGNVLHIPPGTYRLSGPLEVEKRVILSGGGTNSTRLLFDGDTDGVRINFGGTGPVGTYGNYSEVRDLSIYGPAGGVGATRGLYSTTQCQLRNVEVVYFNDGFEIYGNGFEGTNANGWKMYDCKASNYRRHGLYVHGTDANAGVNINFWAVSDITSAISLYDISQHGNVHIAPFLESDSTAYPAAKFSDSGLQRATVIGAYVEQPNAVELGPGTVWWGGGTARGFADEGGTRAQSGYLAPFYVSANPAGKPAAFIVAAGQVSLGADNVVTVHQVAHGLLVGDSFRTTGGDGTSFGPRTNVVATVADADHFTYVDAVGFGTLGASGVDLTFTPIPLPNAIRVGGTGAENEYLTLVARRDGSYVQVRQRGGAWTTYGHWGNEEWFTWNDSGGTDAPSGFAAGGGFASMPAADQVKFTPRGGIRGGTFRFDDFLLGPYEGTDGGNGRRITALTDPTTGGSYKTFHRGDVVFNAKPDGSRIAAWLCVQSGTLGNYTEGRTLTSSGGTTQTLSAASAVLKTGTVILVNGVTVVTVFNTDADAPTIIETNSAIPGGAGLSIAYSPPVFQQIPLFGAGNELQLDRGSDTATTPTISKPSGSFRLNAGQTAVTVINTLCVSTSRVLWSKKQLDATAVDFKMVPGSGSFVFTANAAATGDIDIDFLLVNG